MGVRAKISARKYRAGPSKPIRSGFFPNRSDHVVFKSGPNRSDLQILRFASEQIRTDHIRSQNVRSDRICDRIGYFLRTVKLISQNYCFKSVFFIIKFNERIILLLISNYYVQKMTDNLLSNRTLQLRRFIFITDFKNIFFEFNNNPKKIFEKFPITGVGPISPEKTTQFHDF